MYNILTSEGVISPLAEKKTKNKKKQELRNKIDAEKKLRETEKFLIVNNNILDDDIYEARILLSHASYSMFFTNDTNIDIKEKKKYIPSMNHPWRTSSFSKFIKDIKYLY